MHIPLNTAGRINNSEYPGHRVLVRDDSENTGGFLVFEWWENSNGPNENSAFDSWVEDVSSLEQFFAESDWVVEWDKDCSGHQI